MSGPLLLPAWDQLAARVPGVTEPMRRYLEQIACVLRPGSVVNADLALRCFAAFLAEAAPQVTGLAQITRAACRGLQALAGGPARAEQAGRDPGHDRAPARHAADVLRPHRRMGLGRSPAPGADVPRRPAPPGPPAAQGPR